MARPKSPLFWLLLTGGRHEVRIRKRPGHLEREPRPPDGKRTLCLMRDNGGGSLAPGAMGQNGEPYVSVD